MKKNKKAFTLIELLAVIIILGILLLIAIPSVTKYIENSRKSSYITTAKGYINGARIKVNSNKFSFYDTDATYYVPTKCIALEKGGDSPYGDLVQAYVVINYNEDGYDYYWTSRDSSNMGINLVSEKELDEEDIVSSLKIIDTTKTAGGRSKTIVLNDECNIEEIFTEEGTMLSILKKNATSDENVDFSVLPTKSGNFVVHSSNGTDMPIYYFRGNVTNNNVLFNNLCWKIVRSTELGGVKLIYNGVPSNGTCTGNNSVINGGMSYNNNSSSNSNLIYADSNIKAYVETWYEENMANVTDKLEDASWCNDRSIPEKFILYGSERTNGNGTGTSETYYGSHVRLVKNANESATSIPSLSCSQSDVYTVSNGKIKYPIAFLTADEVVLAGNPWNVTNNSYLANGLGWWTMSPNNYGSGAYVFNVASGGNLDYYGGYTSNGYAVRPSIVIKSGAMIKDGDGTAQKPYTIE